MTKRKPKANEERRPERRRYRKVYVRMWLDAKFLRLSRAEANAQTLWIYLLTSPNGQAVPGLFRSGRAQLAEELGWSLESFDRCFEELFREGMAIADWSARVVWLPNAVRHNEPESPNVVKAWVEALDEVPECDLKSVAINELAEYLSSEKSESFLEVFTPHCGPSGKGDGKPSGKDPAPPSANQEQEQEQEQEGESAPSAFRKPAAGTSVWLRAMYLRLFREYAPNAPDPNTQQWETKVVDHLSGWIVVDERQGDKAAAFAAQRWEQYEPLMRRLLFENTRARAKGFPLPWFLADVTSHFANGGKTHAATAGHIASVSPGVLAKLAERHAAREAEEDARIASLAARHAAGEAVG